MNKTRRVQTGTIIFMEVMGMTHIYRNAFGFEEYGYLDVFKEMNGEPALVNVVLHPLP